MDINKPVTIENCLYKCYEIGSMESTANNDGGVSWRQHLTPRLLERGIYVFDPTREEISKVGMPSEEFLDKLTGWQKGGHWTYFVDGMRKIWRGYSYTTIDKETNSPQAVTILGDVGYVEHSNFLIWNYDEGDKPGGSIAELAIAWYRGIPVYLITNIPKSKINKSLLYFVLDSGHGQGEIFANQNQLIQFIDKKYKLKIIKAKKNENPN